MTNRFIVRKKGIEKKEDKSIIMTLRLDRELQEEFNKLSARSDRSRNELMCMALRFALDHLEFISENTPDTSHPDFCNSTNSKS